MSCSVVAIPYALLWVVGLIAAEGISESISQAKQYNEVSSANEKYLEDRYVLPAENIIEKEFETPFVDKEILIKTLEEHGVVGIEENYQGDITGQIDTYNLKFSRKDSTSPYIIKISCRENDNAEEKVNDVSSEYALNVQEAAYLSIIEKLKENNMQIEEEKVEDDNTIVLTINLE